MKRGIEAGGFIFRPSGIPGAAHSVLNERIIANALIERFRLLPNRRLYRSLRGLWLEPLGFSQANP
jgi:hypothetical protein